MQISTLPSAAVDPFTSLMSPLMLHAFGSVVYKYKSFPALPQAILGCPKSTNTTSNQSKLRPCSNFQTLATTQYSSSPNQCKWIHLLTVHGLQSNYTQNSQQCCCRCVHTLHCCWDTHWYLKSKKLHYNACCKVILMCFSTKQIFWKVNIAFSMYC